MNTKYKNYLLSIDWLKKKNALINKYIENNWEINCHCCGGTSNLQVHHFSYANIFNEVLEDGRIFELGFMCRDCHYKWHKEEGFKEKIESNQLLLFFENINKKYTK